MSASREDIHAAFFPRDDFTPAEALAWASLHGLDHASVRRDGLHLKIVHAPKTSFYRTSLHALSRPSGIMIVIGRPVRAHAPDSRSMEYLKTRAEQETYERYAAKLRERTIEGLDRERSGSNRDLGAWYLRWFARTHPGPSYRELVVRYYIFDGLLRLSRGHALDYVRKLGFLDRRSQN